MGNNATDHGWQFRQFISNLETQRLFGRPLGPPGFFIEATGQRVLSAAAFKSIGEEKRSAKRLLHHCIDWTQSHALTTALKLYLPKYRLE
jgi:hypothetical protein